MYNHAIIEKAAHIAGSHLRDIYPPSHRNGYPCVPSQSIDEISEAVSYLVAEIIQSWIDAGSEREAVMENLGPVIADELKGWSENDADSI